MFGTRTLIPAALAAALLVPLAPAGHAEQAVLIPGATVLKPINPLYPLVATSYPAIGLHFHSDPDPQLVDYSQEALAADFALRDGLARSNATLRQARSTAAETDGKVVVIGESMGSMVAARLAADLEHQPDAPDPADIRFVLIAPPEAGVAEYFPAGTFIPVLNYRVSRIPETPYDTTLVIGEYDGWSDPPDRPWNLLASANALLGIAYVHGPPVAATDLSTVPADHISTATNTKGGTVTTVLAPTRNLPLTQPLRDLGVPGALVDRADRVLRPVIDSGYRRHDRPGDTRPYLYDGQIRRDAAATNPLRQLRSAADDPAADKQAAEPAAEPRALVRRIRAGLREKVTAGLQPSPRKPAGPQPASRPADGGDGTPS